MTRRDVRRARSAARRLRAGWAALAAGLLVALIAVLLVRPGGRILADRTEHVVTRESLPAVTDAEVGLEQRFVAHGDELSQVTVRPATYEAERGCDFVARLDDYTGATVAQRTLLCEEFSEGALEAVLTFDPVEDSAGRSFTLVIGPAPSTTAGVTVWGGEPNGSLPPASFDGEPLDLAMELHTGYGDDERAVELLDTGLRRIRQYGPPWAHPVPLSLLALGALGALLVVVALRGRAALVALLAFAVAKGLLWTALLPPFQGVDEAAHVAYAQFLAVERQVPKRDVALSGREALSVEIRTGLAVFHREAAPPGDRPDLGPGPEGPGEARLEAELDRRAGGGGPAAGYSPAFYLVPAALHELGSSKPIHERVGLMRLWSVALGTALVCGSVLVGRRLFPAHEGAALALGAGVALHPMISQQTAIVNNDALVIAAGVFCLLAALELLRRRSRGLLFLAGAALGVAALAKPFGLAWAPVVAGGWLWGRRRAATPATPWWHDAGYGLAGFALTYGPWFVAQTLFGFAGVGIVGQPQSDERSFSDFLHLLREDWFEELRRNWVEQFWGNFAWLNLPYPRWVYAVVLVAVLAGIALVVAWAVRVAADIATRRRGSGDDRRAEPAAATAVCVGAVLATLGGLSLVGWQYFSQVGTSGLIQGRYALMIVPAVLALPALALGRLAPNLSPVVPLATVASAMAALQIGALALVVERFYL